MKPSFDDTHDKNEIIFSKARFQVFLPVTELEISFAKTKSPVQLKRNVYKHFHYKDFYWIFDPKEEPAKITLQRYL